MKSLTWIIALSVLSVPQIKAQAPPAPMHPAWAFLTPDKDQPAAEESKEPRHIPGSTQAYTPAQIDNLGNPPDWFPDEHGKLPTVVVGGGPKPVLACGSCHLYSGHGHPESADLTGFTEDYIVRQMADFKSGARKDPVRMSAIAKITSEADARMAAEYFSSLKPTAWVRVVEADSVPKSYVSARGRMRLPRPEGGMEALGDRIVELPDDASLATARDPKSGFVAYVPVGSIARGERLVMTGGAGKTITCTICHGDELRGLGDVPRIAGLHPIYIGRQLSFFQTDAYNGTSSALMKKVVANLNDDDKLAIAAYLASLAAQ